MILLHLISKKLDNDKFKEWLDKLNPKCINPKDYPFREELLVLLKKEFPDFLLKEITTPIPLKESKELIKKAKIIICIDSYLQHLCWIEGKQAIVLFGQGDPKIFGHSNNVNLLKDLKYLRPNQYWRWEQTPYIPESFVEPSVIIEEAKKLIKSI